MIKSGGKNSILGFTLTEILAVIVIIGILAATALPRFGPQREKAVVAEAVGMLSAIRQGEEGYLLRNGTYFSPVASPTTDWLILGLEDPNTGAANQRWDYLVNVVAGPPPTFQAVARRCTSANCGSFGTNVTIDQAGSYGASTHPNAPSD